MDITAAKKKVIELCREKNPTVMNPISNTELIKVFGHANRATLLTALTQLKGQKVLDFKNTSGRNEITEFHDSPAH